MTNPHTPPAAKENMPEASSRSLPREVSKEIRLSLRRMRRKRAVAAFKQLFGAVRLGNEFLKNVNKTATYIAKIPKHLEKGFSAGDLRFMVKGDTGETLGTIVDAANQNRGFVRIEPGAPMAAGLSASLADLALQQQLANLADVVEDVRSRVAELKVIHDHDLLGTLRGMHSQLQSITTAEDGENRRDLLISAITVLHDTLGRVEQRLADELSRLPEVPDNGLVKAAKIFWSAGYLDKVQEGFETAQELFDYYLAGMQLLAYAYAMLGESGIAGDVLVPRESLIYNPDLVKMTKAETLCADMIRADVWYKTPEEYLERIALEAKQIFAGGQDVLSIEITGEEILEAMNDAEG